MAMEAAEALEQDIDRREIGDQKVGVDVEALLQRLCAHEDHGAVRALPPNGVLHGPVEKPPVAGAEATMVEGRETVDAEQGRIMPRQLLNGRLSCNRIAHQIAVRLAIARDYWRTLDKAGRQSGETDSATPVMPDPETD
ncbi:hypothetical protein V5F76_20025 [Xanthobacter agilis]